MTENEVANMKPLVLAFVGDAVYEQYIRDMLVRKPHRDVNDLHRKAIGYVSAGAQAAILLELEPKLTGSEQDVVRRGRNAHPNTIAKNTDVMTYHMATALETLIGYLHLTEQGERLDEILAECVSIGEKNYELRRQQKQV